MFKKLVTTLIVIVAASAVIYAEDPYAIVDKYIEVTKAKQRQDSIQTLKFSAQETGYNPQTGQSMTATIKYWFKKDSLYRIEQDAQGNKMMIGFDGKTLWWTNPEQSNKITEVQSSYRDNVLQQIRGENIVGGNIAKYKEDSTKFEFVETVTVDEKQCHKLKFIPLKSEQEMYMYFDAISGLMYQLEVKTPQGPYFRKTVSVTKSAGYFFPMKVEEWIGDKKVSDKIYQSITVNPKIDDRFFGMPENK